MLGPVGLQLNLRELGDAIDKRCDLAPEYLLDLLFRGDSIFNCVVEKCCYDRRRIQLQLGQDTGHFYRMRKIRVAGGTHLAAMSFDRKNISPV